jgi:hypothetical protein
MIESFSSLPLQDIIPSYLYQQYSDDSDLQAFVASFNALAQGYLDWFNQTPLAVYTSPAISGPLLDWVGNGLYGIARPVIASTSVRSFGGWDTSAYDTQPFNQATQTRYGTALVASDDIYKRALTWNLYRGDGMQMSLPWVRRRVARFLFGANGSDIDVGLLPQVSITNSKTLIVGATDTVPTDSQATNATGTETVTYYGAINIIIATTSTSEALQALLAEKILAFPFQVKPTVTLT